MSTAYFLPVYILLSQPKPTGLALCGSKLAANSAADLSPPRSRRKQQRHSSINERLERRRCKAAPRRPPASRLMRNKTLGASGSLISVSANLRVLSEDEYDPAHTPADRALRPPTSTVMDGLPSFLPSLNRCTTHSAASSIASSITSGLVSGILDLTRLLNC